GCGSCRPAGSRRAPGTAHRTRPRPSPARPARSPRGTIWRQSGRNRAVSQAGGTSGSPDSCRTSFSLAGGGAGPAVRRLKACRGPWPGRPFFQVWPPGPSTRNGTGPFRGATQWRLLDGDGALHERRVAREAAEERIRARAELGDREGHRGAFATADELRVRNDAAVADLDVVRGRAGLDAVGVDALHVGRGGDHDVVAHRDLRQLAGVLEIDGEILAALVDVDVGDVELHCVVAFEVDR